jgi:hypothetical protein
MRLAIALCLLFSVGYVGTIFGIAHWITDGGANAGRIWRPH